MNNKDRCRRWREEHPEYAREYNRKRRMDPDLREEQNKRISDWKKKKWAEDAEYRQKQNDRIREWRKRKREAGSE